MITYSAIIFLHSPTGKEETGSPNIFSNDGSFMSQYKALIDKQNREKQEKEAKEKQESEENRIQNESKQKAVSARQEAHDGNEGYNQEREQDRGSRYQTTCTFHITSSYCYLTLKFAVNFCNGFFQVPYRIASFFSYP